MPPLVEVIIKTWSYKNGKACACCGGPINIGDGAVTFYGPNDKCRRAEAFIGTRSKSSQDSELVWNLRNQLIGCKDQLGVGNCPWDFISYEAKVLKPCL